MNLFEHPLSTPTWEQEHASPVTISTRALWTQPEEGVEEEAPAHRIIHQRVVFSHVNMTLGVLEFPQAAGYHKCASAVEVDSVTHSRVYVAKDGEWALVGESRGENLDLTGIETTAALVQIRSCQTDGFWPGWNLAVSGLVLNGTAVAEYEPSPGIRVDDITVDLHDLPDGTTALERMGELRYTTPHLSVGFRLASPAWSYLSVDDDGAGDHGQNLLQMPRSMDIVRSGVYPSGVYPVLRDINSEYLAHGPRLTLIDGLQASAFIEKDMILTTVVQGNRVIYRVNLPCVDVKYELIFTVLTDRINMEVTRASERQLRAWHSSAWHVATDNRVTPSAVTGHTTRVGETGLIEGPAFWHFPRRGTLAVSSTGNVLVRSDSVRALDTNTFEVKLDEQATELGDYVIPAGISRGSVSFIVSTPELATVTGAPASVSRMLSRHAITALSYRPDTTTYSNNGASMHCTTSLNDVSAIATRLAAFPDGMHPMDLVGLSLERWLNGAPSYGSGRTSHGGHLLEDEYVHLAADTLLAVGRFLNWTSGSDWFAAHRTVILARIEEMLARDVDGDGLVESTIRRGRSGEHQWSTAWCDVLSFGWKDAWANAVLYEAWRELATAMNSVGEDAFSQRLTSAADAIRAVYQSTFLNPDTGWVAGWRSEDGHLHDYAFPVVNGAAASHDLLTDEAATGAMRGIWNAITEVGFRDLRMGLPLNLYRVPEYDIGGVVFGLPMGGYQQGGASHHRLRVVVDALDRVGMTLEADELLEKIAESIADDTAFGGIGSGKDWRMWDGTPSGYEGQLIEGFSVMASALRRYSTSGEGGVGK